MHLLKTGHDRESINMTITRMNNEQPPSPHLRDNMVAALANGAAGILLHVKWPLLLEMELAQAALQENVRPAVQADGHRCN